MFAVNYSPTLKTIGLGWLESFVGGIYTSGSWNTSPAFYVVSGTGIMMIALGVWLHTKELKLPKYQNPTDD